MTRLLPQLLEELVQKRDNARGLPRLDSLACLKQAPRPRSCTEIAPQLPRLVNLKPLPPPPHTCPAAGGRQPAADLSRSLGSRHRVETRTRRAGAARAAAAPCCAPRVLVRLKRLIQLRMSELGVVDILSSLLPSALASAPASPAGSGPRIAAKLL